MLLAVLRLELCSLIRSSGVFLPQHLIFLLTFVLLFIHHLVNVLDSAYNSKPRMNKLQIKHSPDCIRPTLQIPNGSLLTFHSQACLASHEIVPELSAQSKTPPMVPSAKACLIETAVAYLVFIVSYVLSMDSGLTYVPETTM